MRFIFAALIALLTSVVYCQSVADLVGQLPSCALTCLATAATSVNCGLADYKCQCGPAKTALTNAATPCILSGCSSDDAGKVLTISGEICAAVAGTSSSTTVAPIATGSSASAIGATPTTTSAASSTSSRPVLQTVNAAPRAQAGASFVVGAALLVAFAL